MEKAGSKIGPRDVGRLSQRGFSSEFIAKKLGVEVERVRELRAEVERFEAQKRTVRCLRCFSNEVIFEKNSVSFHRFACQACGWKTSDGDRKALLAEAKPVLAAIAEEARIAQESWIVATTTKRAKKGSKS